MAKLQLPTQAQIAPGQVPGVQVAAPQARGGEVAAQQLGAVGQAVTQAAQQASQIQIDVLERANALRVNQAMNENRRNALNLEYGPEGFRQRKGEAAMPMSFDGRSLASAYSERYESGVDEIYKSLGNDAQRAAFRAQADQFGAAFQNQAQTYEFAEMRTYEQSVLDGGIMLGAEEAATAYDNPDRVFAAISQVGALAEEKMKSFGGLSANERTARTQVLQSSAVVGVVKAAADAGDLSLARQYIERFDKTLTSDDKTRLDAIITPAMDAQLAQTVVADIFAGKDATPVAPITGEDVVLRAPVSDASGSGFGPRVAPATRGGNQGSSNHGGTDYRSAAGTTVRSAAQGTVKFAGERGGYGNLVIVEHPDGRETWYAHLSSIGVQRGQTVGSQAEIAKSGDTGNVSGPHLHFEVRVNGQAVDPSTQLGERHAGAGRRAAAASPASSGPPATRLEAEQRALAALGSRATPEQVTATRREVDRAWTLREEAIEDRAASAVETAQAWLATNGGNFAGLPASMRAAVPPKYMDDLIRYGAAFEKKDEIKETPPGIYYQLQDDRELMGLSDAEFLSLRARVKDNDWEAAARRRQALRSTTPTRDQQNSAQIIPRDRLNAATDVYFADLGIPRTGGGNSGRDQERRRRVGAVQQVVDSAVLEAQAAAGRQLNDDELRRLVGPLFAQRTTIDRGLFGRTDIPLFGATENQIKSSPEWDGIRRRFEDQGVRNPTDTQIETAYYRVKMGIR